MDLQEIKKVAREKMKGYCRVCKVCNGIACAGEVPGMGGVGTGSAFTANIDTLAQIKLNLGHYIVPKTQTLLQSF